MSLYPISTACPKCGAKPHTVCSNILSQACDERWIAAGVIDVRDATTNPETAGVEPVEVVRERLGKIASLANVATIFHEEAMMRTYQTIAELIHPAPASNTTSVREALQRLQAVRDGGDLSDVYGSEWCLDMPRQFRADLGAALAAIRSGSECCKGGPQWGHAWDCPKCPD